VHRAIVTGPDIGATNQWLVWPTLGLLLAGSFLPLVLDGGAIVRAFQQLLPLGRRPAGPVQPGASGVSARVWAVLLAASAAGLLVLGSVAFQMSPLVTLAALALALVLANVSARATGETDMGPAGPMGTVSMIALSGRGPVPGVMAGAVTMGSSTQTAQMLWAFRAGHLLGASPRAQIGAQILGVVVGAVVSVPIYGVVVSTYGLANEALPAIGAVTWKATAQALQGLSTLPRGGSAALLVSLGAGVVLTLLGRLRIGRLLPSAAAVGVGFMLPFSYTLTAVAGAVLGLLARRLFRGLDQPSLLALAAGGMAGESIIGVLVPILIAVGVL
jgi:uncharacterized oligopeptide transporter (OPT) family protein